MDEYKTLNLSSEGLYKEKGSRFIAIALPVHSTEEVKLKLDQLRKVYHDARHHCFAYRIGPEPGEVRYNDDGEPSGTAGKPILGQIQSSGITNILIVVIRYFGGIKLGTGGLIRAYKSAARNAIENGEIVTLTWKVKIMISFPYEKMNTVMKIIKEENLHIIQQEMKEFNCIVLEINKSSFEKIKTKLLSSEISDLTVI
jgi:uncharacterized YigZ family protein